MTTNFQGGGILPPGGGGRQLAGTTEYYLMPASIAVQMGLVERFETLRRKEGDLAFRITMSISEHGKPFTMYLVRRNRVGHQQIVACLSVVVRDDMVLICPVAIARNVLGSKVLEMRVQQLALAIQQLATAPLWVATVPESAAWGDPIAIDEANFKNNIQLRPIEAALLRTITGGMPAKWARADTDGVVQLNTFKPSLAAKLSTGVKAVADWLTQRLRFKAKITQEKVKQTVELNVEGKPLDTQN